MFKVKKSLAVIIVAVSLVLLVAVGSQAKQKPILLRMAYPSADRGLVPELIKWWGQEVERKTEGKIKVDYYWGGLLGKSKELLYSIKNGTADVGTIFPMYFSAELPLMTMNTCIISTHVNDPVATSRALNQVVIENPIIASEWEKYNQKLLLAYEAGPYVWVSKSPIRKLADLKNMKIGPWGGKGPRALIKQMGSVPITVPSVEVYDALNKGMLNGRAEQPNMIITYKHYEICKYVTDVGNGTTAPPVYGMSINLDKWNSIPEDLQKVVLEVNKDFWKVFGDKTRGGIVEQMNFLKEKGVEFIKFSDRDRKTISELPVYPEFKQEFRTRCEKAKIDPEKIWGRYFELLKAYGQEESSMKFEKKWKGFFARN
jgi:TRAP-type C4-dicarboxylate transport system substrate-binding protein